MNGSSATGNCSSISHGVVTSTCTDPTSSVLFDGVIPTLTGLDGDMWASQLLTLQRPMPSINIDITTPLSRVEVTMFNCPEWRISVQSISLRDNDGIVIGSSGDLNSITSCDSLVRLCVPATAINPLVVTAQFDLGTDSNWVHLAEVTFYNDNTTCPPNTTIDITTEINTATHTNTPLHPTTPTTTTITTQGMTTGFILDMKSSEDTPNDATTPDKDKADESVIIPVVVVICVVLMIVGIMAAVLILWRYHKHKTSHHTALGEGHSHAHTHSHPPLVKTCEETGQVCDSSPPEALGQLSPSHDTYSHLQRDTSEGRGGAQSEEADTAVDHFYAILEDKNEVATHLNKSEADTADMLYARVGKKKIKKKKSNATHPNTSETDTAVDHFYAVLEDNCEKKKGEVATHLHTPEADTAVDHFEGEVATHLNRPEADKTDMLYARVDKKKISKKKATHPDAPETDTALDHFYAVLEDNCEGKKDEVTSHPHTPEADTAADQLCAHVDKNQKEKEVSVPLQESGPVYSALNKPSPPQLPAKSDLLMEDLQTP